MSSTIFSPAKLLNKLKSFPTSGRYWVAYSGGMDSHVLLKGLHSLTSELLPARLAAVHVNHGINERAGEWAGYCENICRQLGIEFRLLEIEGVCPGGHSPEAWARDERYKHLSNLLGRDEMLLTAHHQDDQAETLLLQLMRGSGPRGLAAMPELRRLGAGWHARPLLHFPRQTLHVFAGDSNLAWIEDDSNLDTGYDRNYLRHQVLPVLSKRWLNLSKTLARAASHQAEAVEIMAELAKIDLADCSLQGGKLLNIPCLQQLSEMRRKNVLRYWLQRLGFPMPDRRKLQHLMDDVIAAREDANPRLSWAGVEIRRYRHLLCAAPLQTAHDNRHRQVWNLKEPCHLTHGELIAGKGRGRGIKLSACPDNSVEIRFRTGGERLKPAGSRQHHELKTLLQEAGVPPWYRDRIPLLYIQGQLACVTGFWIDDSFRAADEEDAWRINWTGLDEILLFTECANI